MEDSLGIILFILFCVIGSLSSKKKKGSQKKTNTQTQQAPVQRAPQPKEDRPVFVPKTPAVQQSAERPQPKQQRYYDSTCMDANSQHDHNRRIEQLKDFLKDGIITREEYRILLAKYEKNQ